MAQTDRKELMTNELVKGITSTYEGLKKGPSRRTIITLALILTVVALIFLFRYFIVSSTTTDSKNWLIFDTATFPNQVTSSLEDKELADTSQLQALRFKDARMKLARGVRNLGSADSDTRKKAREDVMEAKNTYEELSKKASSLSPQLHQESLWGAAKAYETLGRLEDLEEARKLYEQLRKEYPKSALGKDAKKQLDRLEDPTTRKNLADLARERDAR